MWVIKHKPTGTFLPNARGRGGRGGTHVEVGQGGGIPRIFLTKTAAKSSLKWWLRGKVNVSHSQDYWGEWDESWSTTPVPDRKAEDMEVVEVTLKEVETCSSN